MKCNHRLGWWNLKNGTKYECMICGETMGVEEYNHWKREAEEKIRNCKHEHTHIIQGTSGYCYTVCDICNKNLG